MVDADCTVVTRLEELKAELWGLDLQDIVDTEVCTEQMASKFAGRFQWSVTSAGDKIGRGFVRPFYAQLNAPLNDNRASIWLLLAVNWWQTFCLLRPTVTHAAYCDREHVRMWTDASGEGAMVSAVIAYRGRYFHTYMAVPEWIYTQCSERGDHYIAILETVAVILGVTTFQQVLQNTVLTAFNDNMVSLFSIIKGSSRCPEINIIVSKLWMTMAELQVNFPCIQITSDSNVADGPSRNRVTTVDEYGTTHETPLLPRWLERLMQFHELPESKKIGRAHV
jgi:hypothetical protein